MSRRKAALEAELQALLDAVRLAGPAGLLLSKHVRDTGVPSHTVQWRMRQLANRGDVGILVAGQFHTTAPRCKTARWVLRPAQRPSWVRVGTTHPWPWDDRGRSALVADATIDRPPERIRREAYDASVMYSAAASGQQPAQRRSGGAVPSR